MKGFHTHVPFVVVEWHDAWKSATEDATVENAGDSQHYIVCFSAGWVLRDDDMGIQIANEYSPDGTHRGRSFIPRAMVKGVTPVVLTKVRNKKEAGNAGNGPSRPDSQ